MRASLGCADNDDVVSTTRAPTTVAAATMAAASNRVLTWAPFHGPDAGSAGYAREEVLLQHTPKSGDARPRVHEKSGAFQAGVTAARRELVRRKQRGGDDGDTVLAAIGIAPGCDDGGVG